MQRGERQANVYSCMYASKLNSEWMKGGSRSLLIHVVQLVVCSLDLFLPMTTRQCLNTVQGTVNRKDYSQ